jgi:L-ribulose-5-phosphate 3-epimerase UlaE
MREASVMLALENVDGDDVASVNQAMIFVDALDSPWFQVYPDIGNLAEMRFAGPVLLEMWNDDSPEALQIVQRASGSCSAWSQAGCWQRRTKPHDATSAT